MENISPCLILLWDVKRALEKGQSVSNGVKNYLQRKDQNEFSNQIELWWSSHSNAKTNFQTSHMTTTRRYLLEILELGLKGQSILETLRSYEIELIQSCEDEIHNHLAKLPLLLMIPLMGLIFPALMLLLLGPLLKALQF